MAYDEDLADRTRDVLADMTSPHAAVERKMFGGLAFMVNTHMACGLVGADLMVRVGPDHHDEARADGAREMDFTGRPMRGMVVVPAELVADPVDLRAWVTRGVSHAQSLPAKAPKPRRASKPRPPHVG